MPDDTGIFCWPENRDQRSRSPPPKIAQNVQYRLFFDISYKIDRLVGISFGEFFVAALCPRVYLGRLGGALPRYETIKKRHNNTIDYIFYY